MSAHNKIKKSIKQKIIIDAKKKGIDPRMFCFDVDKRDNLLTKSSKKSDYFK